MAGTKYRPERVPRAICRNLMTTPVQTHPNTRFRVALIVGGIWFVLLAVALFSYWISELPAPATCPSISQAMTSLCWM